MAVTHCVSARDARTLTQMDTNKAGTPKMRTVAINGPPCMGPASPAVPRASKLTPPDDGEGPQVVLVREEGHEDEAV